MPILITGSSGLIGCALRARLGALGLATRGLDLRATDDSRGDIRDPERLREAVGGCEGIVHLAAVSRVIWGERDPELCHATNVIGTRSLLDCARRQNEPPWVIFASSREVYGQPRALPANEDTPLQPINAYGRAKVLGEELMLEARDWGLRTAVVRLSNVYGDRRDHPDRVIPAFARAALQGAPLRLDGPDSTFDFTHLDDTVEGLLLVINRLSRSEILPPIQFATGVGTTLLELARLAIELAESTSELQLACQRNFDVPRFWGSPARAEALLGWSPRVPIRKGLGSLMTALVPLAQRGKKLNE